MLLLATPCRADAPGEPHALMLVFVQRPWSNWTAPVFALYDDGTVIFERLRDPGSPHLFYRTTLTTEQVTHLSQSVAAVATNSHYYNLGSGPDRPSQILWVKTPQGARRIEVYGESTSHWPGAPQDRLPPGLGPALHQLETFRHAAAPWMPIHIEIDLWPSPDPISKSAKWPTGWPDLSSPGSMQHDTPAYHSVFLPTADFQRFLALQHDLEKDNHSIVISGQRWSLQYQFPFPDEDTVRHALNPH